MKMVPAFITVRSASSRLPEKCLLKFGQSSVLEFVIKRVIANGLNAIICTTDQPEDDAIQDLATNYGTEIYRGSASNKMLRWLKCCEHFGFDFFHTIDADDPFFCPNEVKRSVGFLEDNPNIDIVKPSQSSASGGATVGYSIRYRALKKALSDVADDADTEMIGGILDSTKELKQSTLSEPDSCIITSRMTLDYWEDYIFYQYIVLVRRATMHKNQYL